MKEKIEVSAVCITYFVAICFGLSIVVFLGSEALGSKMLYEFLKDQGSLIAGLIGIMGVIILVVVQIRTNRTLINSSKEIVYMERFEIDRDAAIYELHALDNDLDRIFNSVNWGQMNKADYSSILDACIKSMKLVMDKTVNLEKFIKKYDVKDIDGQMQQALNFLLLYVSIYDLIFEVINRGGMPLFQYLKENMTEEIDNSLSKLNNIFSEQEKDIISDGFSAVGTDKIDEIRKGWDEVREKIIPFLKKKILKLKY